MSDQIVMQGVELMLYGMGTVVVFLALLVVVTTAMSRLISRYFPEPQLPVPAARRRPQPAAAAPAAAGDEVIAAIGAALHQHRSRKQ